MVKISRLVVAAAAVIAIAVPLSADGSPTRHVVGAPSGQAAKLAISVKANHLIGPGGKPMRLLGVDRSGTEYACAQGWGIFDGPDTSASIKAMTTWHINAVRLPLNEGCWLGVLSGTTYQGSVYRSAIETYVKRLQAHGLYVILELSGLDESQPSDENVWPMADAQYSPKFWASIAHVYRHNSGVLFDAYNEPHDISWKCWKSGCKSPLGYQAAGMQQLVNAIRRAGANQPIMLGGLGYSSDLTGWQRWKPRDPDHQLVASFHTYNFSGCNTASCWNSTIAPLAKAVPVVTGEFGENDCEHSYTDAYMKWADAHGVSYLGWTWDAGGGWTCDGGPTLITNYNGTPTGLGEGLKRHLAALARHHQ